jgi:hypothetical protein
MRTGARPSGIFAGERVVLVGEGFDQEFIRRFLLDVLPRGFVRIRHYGLATAGARDISGFGTIELCSTQPSATTSVGIE